MRFFFQFLFKVDAIYVQVISATIISIVLAAPQFRGGQNFKPSFGSSSSGQNIPILRYENTVNHDGSYRWRFV